MPLLAAGILLSGASPAFAASAASVLTLTATPNPSGNYVALNWTNSDKSQPYSYMLYSKSAHESTFQSIPAKDQREGSEHLSRCHTDRFLYDMAGQELHPAEVGIAQNVDGNAERIRFQRVRQGPHFRGYRVNFQFQRQPGRLPEKRGRQLQIRRAVFRSVGFQWESGLDCYCGNKD